MDEHALIKSDEHQPLLGHQSRLASKFRVTVEPVLIIFVFYRMLATIMIQQFVYHMVADSKNITVNSTDSDCSLNSSDIKYIQQEEVQRESSLWMIYLNLCTLIPALFSTVFAGSYSDKGGRRIALILPHIGSLIKMYLIIFIILYDLPLYVLLIAGVLEGSSGGIVMFIMAAFSYISDVTSHENRSMRIIILEVCIGFTGTFSYLVSGFTIQSLDFLGTCLILHIILVINLVVVVFCIPETITPQGGIKFFTLSHFKRTFKVYFRDDGRGRRTILLMTLLILILDGPVALGREDVEVLFMLNSPLCWNSVLIGFFKATYFFLGSIGSILLTKFVQPWLGDLSLIIIGSVSATGAGVFMAFSVSKLMMFLVPVVGIFSMVQLGMVRAFNSKVVEPDEIGAMFSWFAWLELLGSMLGSVSLNAVYRASLHWFKGMVFIVVACGYFLAGLVTLALIIKLKIQHYRHNSSVILYNSQIVT